MSKGAPGKLVGVRLGVGTGVDADAGVRGGVWDLVGETAGVWEVTADWIAGVVLKVMHAAVTPSKPAVNAKATCLIHNAYGSRRWLTASR